MHSSIPPSPLHPVILCLYQQHQPLNMSIQTAIPPTPPPTAGSHPVNLSDYTIVPVNDTQQQLQYRAAFVPWNHGTSFDVRPGLFGESSISSSDILACSRKRESPSRMGSGTRSHHMVRPPAFRVDIE